MEKEAIKLIQDTASVPGIQAAVEATRPFVPVAVVPDSMKVESLEQFMEFRSFYAKKFSTPSIDDFIAYCEIYDREDAECYIDSEDPQRLEAVTIFDIGSLDNPEHKRHQATLRLKQTAAFAAIMNLNGRKLSQKDASEFIEDWKDFISLTDQEGDEVSAVAGANKIRSITIEAARNISSEVGDFSEEMTAAERIEAKHSGAGSLPAFMAFTFIPYNSFNPYSFEVRLSVLTGGDKPAISFRIMQLESCLETIAEEFKEKLVQAFETKEIETYIGTVS